MRRLFIYGFPGLYGGAATELHHQILVWKELDEIELHIIPTMAGYNNEPLINEMDSYGIQIHKQHNFSMIEEEDAVINFCSGAFQDNLWAIEAKTKRTIFVNCMTYLFDDEKKNHAAGRTGFSLYQRPQVRDQHRIILESLGSKSEFLTFVPYFDPSSCVFSVKDQEKTHIGRISRDAQNKYTPMNKMIYGGIVSPKMKQGHWLGWGTEGNKITGKPQEWIKCYYNQTQFPVKEFYDTVDFIVQPTNTAENWPRIGFEAMFSGKPLVVDNREGWQHMIEHGKTGFLCNHERDFIYWGSRLAYEPELRVSIAERARERARELSGFKQSRESWKRIFERVFN